MPDWHYATEPEPEPHVLQGDVFAEVDVFVPAHDLVFAATTRVLVISHDCDFTKSQTNRPDTPLLVVPVRPVRDLADNLQGHAEADRVVRYMRLPDEGPTGDVCVADLALIQPVSARRLVEADRLARMDEEGRQALADRVLAFLFQSERRPSE